MITEEKTNLRLLSAVSRRAFIRRSGQLTLSASAITLLAGRGVMAAGHTAIESGADVSILNVALALEHEAINAYQLGAESGLLQKPVLDVAVLFQSHHKEHADALAATIRKMGGTPVEEKRISEYAVALEADTLRNQTDVLTLAARLEKAAANAYLGVIPAFENSELAQIAGRLAADETMHWALLGNALGQPVPTMALSFGA